MPNSSNTTQKKMGVALVIATLILSVAGVVAAQSGPSAECSGSTVTFGTEFFGLEDGGNRLLSTSPTSREYALPTPLPAGDYDLNGVSYDGYEQRDTISPQPQEQWYAELLGSDGSVLATSGLTADLVDEVTEDSWSGSLGSVTIASAATAVRVVHAAPGSASVNSVRPVCLGAIGGPEATTTTTAAPAPDSSVTVDFNSTATASSRVSITCDDLQESALGNDIDLTMTDLAASTGCVVEYPAELDCMLSVDPRSTAAASASGIQNIAIPVAGDVDVTVIIDCVEAQVATPAPTPTTTTVAPAVTTTTTKPAVEVAGQVETAPAATAQTGQPAFTG